MDTTGKVTMGEQPPPYPQNQPAGPPMHNPGYAMGQPLQPYPQNYQHPPQAYQHPQHGYAPQPHHGYAPQPQGVQVVVNQGGHHPAQTHHATTVIVHKRGVNHCLHFLISLLFFPWILVWIALCIADGC